MKDKNRLSVGFGKVKRTGRPFSKEYKEIMPSVLAKRTKARFRCCGKKMKITPSSDTIRCQGKCKRYRVNTCPWLFRKEVEE